MNIVYKPKFLRQFKKLPQSLQDEAREKMGLFAENTNHPFLKTHRLKGRLKGFWSFSVNYKDRIVFQYENHEGQKRAALLAIGDHGVYQ